MSHSRPANEVAMRENLEWGTCLHECTLYIYIYIIGVCDKCGGEVDKSRLQTIQDPDVHHPQESRMKQSCILRGKSTDLMVTREK